MNASTEDPMSDLVTRLAEKWSVWLMPGTHANYEDVEDARWWIAALADEIANGALDINPGAAEVVAGRLRSQIQATPDSEVP